jgi:ABC-type lipoprotein release transport system permease subunit
MDALKYSWLSFLHFRKEHFLLILGTFLATAVLTGALLVGYSVRESLKEYSENKIGRTEWLIDAGSRFFPNDLGERLSESTGVEAAAVLNMNAVSVAGPDGISLPGVRVYGIDKDFTSLFPGETPDIPAEGEVLINQRCAGQLNLKAGDTLILKIPIQGGLPGENVFARYSRESESRLFRIAGILPDYGIGAFDVRIGQETKALVYCRREVLETMASVENSANLLLISPGIDNEAMLKQELSEIMGLRDYGLRLRRTEQGLLLISDSLFMQKVYIEAAEKLDLPAQSVFSYFLNRVRSKNWPHNQFSVPFVFAVGLDNDSNIPAVPDIESDTGIVSTLLASDLGVAAGDTICLDYYLADNNGLLREKTAAVTILAIVDQKNFDELKTLLPEFPGLSGASSCREWDPGVPIDLDLVRPADERFWEIWGASPRIVISRQLAEELWAGPFGVATGLLIHTDLSVSELDQRFAGLLDLSRSGFRIENIKQKGEYAGENAVDFAGLFIGLSFFLIAAALVFITLIYGIFFQFRTGEIGTLRSLGVPPSVIHKLFGLEVCFPIISGVVMGGIGGLGFNVLVIRALKTVWIGVVRTANLQAFISIPDMLFGIGVSFTVCIISVLVSMRYQFKQDAGVNLKQLSGTNNKWQIFRLIAALSGIIFLAIMLIWCPFEDKIDQQIVFYIMGIVLLTSFFSAAGFLLNGARKFTGSIPLKSLRQWIIKRLTISPGRSMGVILIFGSAVFLLTAISGFQHPPGGVSGEMPEGSGGYHYWAETVVPLVPRLTDISDELKLPPGWELLSLYKRPGDDAGCLNLNHIESPQILGVDPEHLKGRFAFTGTEGEDTTDPWQLLNLDLGPGIIPAIADQSVITWNLKKNLGDSLSIIDEYGREIQLKLVAGLKTSIFHGNLIVSSQVLKKHFPSVSGYNLLLFREGEGADETERENLQRMLRGNGLYWQSVPERLALFKTVENTYLTIFAMLGWLALLLGSTGLGVMLYNEVIMERRTIALMHALGFTRLRIILILIGEKCLLLLYGAAAGIISALLAVKPVTEISSTSSLHAGMLLAVILSGITWLFLASLYSLRLTGIRILSEESQ